MAKYKMDEPKTLVVNEPAAVYAAHSQNYVDAGIFSVMNTAKQGISYKSFDVLSKKLPFSMQDWAEFLHVSGKTLSRYQKEDKTFDTPQSEKILQIEILYAKGKEVFGSSEYFLIWLQTENLALGKIKPQEILDSSFGIFLLMDELTKIEHGVLA